MSAAERETHLNMTGDDHETWSVFSDDPYMIRRLERIGAERVKPQGAGYVFRLRADQVLLRKGKRTVSAATRKKLSFNLQNLQSDRQNQGA